MTHPASPDSLPACAPLTRRQREVLEFIVDHIDRRGWPPTCLEIAEGLSIGSQNAVRDHCARLDRKGAIARSPGVARGIRVLVDPAKVPAPP
ncbi:MAG: hypothetical protein U5O39_03365 [Gammaproteobacteria bacterium]|nr:hypothetical protein [Gammaproteobacteria bacterium]